MSCISACRGWVNSTASREQCHGASLPHSLLTPPGSCPRDAGGETQTRARAYRRHGISTLLAAAAQRLPPAEGRKLLLQRSDDQVHVSQVLHWGGMPGYDGEGREMKGYWCCRRAGATAGFCSRPRAHIRLMNTHARRDTPVSVWRSGPRGRRSPRSRRTGRTSRRRGAPLGGGGKGGTGAARRAGGGRLERGRAAGILGHECHGCCTSPAPLSAFVVAPVPTRIPAVVHVCAHSWRSGPEVDNGRLDGGGRELEAAQV